MNFVYLKYAPIALAVFLIFSFIYFKNSARFKVALAKYWALRPKIRYRLSHLFYTAFIFLLLLATMDLRGPEETIEGSVSDQKTLIVIDTSSSMLAEDVRPNRFEKAVMLAKHFVRSAYGHQVGVIVFSDIQKMLIPFTDDIDLLDARLGSLLEQRELSGGSNLYQTLREAVQYFVADGDNDPTGNILLLSDAEAHDETFNVEIPDEVNVAVIGIGTTKGAPIPNRENGGRFRGYKKFNGEIVNSSLDEDLLKSLGEGITHYKYWVVQGYSLPTEDILSFFNNSYLEKLSKSTQRVRPVLGHYLVILGVLLYALSVILTRGKTFRPIMIYLLIGGFYSAQLKAQEALEEMKQGKLDLTSRMELARGLFDNEQYHEARTLYEETKVAAKGEMPLQADINWATSMMAAGETRQGLQELAKLEEMRNQLTPQEMAIMRSNILNAVKQDQEEQEKQQQEQEQEQQQNKDKGKGDNQQQDQQQNKKQQNEKDQNKEEQKSGDQPENQKDNQGEKSKEEQLKEHQAKQRQQRAMKKVPALVKQVLEDDRKLQEEYWDTTTSKPEEYSQPKDW